MSLWGNRLPRSWGKNDRPQAANNGSSGHVRVGPELGTGTGGNSRDLAALEHLGISFPAFSGSPRVSLKPKPMAGMGRQDMSLRELELIAPIVECPKLRKYYY